MRCSVFMFNNVLLLPLTLSFPVLQAPACRPLPYACSFKQNTDVLTSLTACYTHLLLKPSQI